ILTGIGTVRADNPLLSVRGIGTPRPPQRILVDSRLVLPLDARLLGGPPLLLFSGRLDASGEMRATELESGRPAVVAL
ncbi:dihydrofolate reductase family protein, partial [Burkholderia sp. GbtcB21]|uniref:dihydrofolate reductase family protein n=1 Tax=Burkholderia sp. GbtcB21 TaxID=2824766 RepID=UPI001C2F197E